MQKNILITGATDGIGFETAKMLLTKGYNVSIHGRNPEKIVRVGKALTEQTGKRPSESYQADLANLQDVVALAAKIQAPLDVLINNAGVFQTRQSTTANGLDVRFVVNTIAPYLLTQRLMPKLQDSARIINVSSAAQTSVDLAAMQTANTLTANAAYAQSKLAIIMWSNHLAKSLNDKKVILSVNPGSLLGSKMVKEAYGIAGGNVAIGGEILKRTAIAEEFATASGKYFDNDSRQLALPHPDALDADKNAAVVATIESILSQNITDKL